ncbi:MAG: iron-sulfur cluster biosynthesis transcriptional regulator SufR [Elainellaceae cyanobacterium]
MTASHPPSSKEDILQYLAKQGQATAQNLAGYLNISPQATRRHLKDLEIDGLIEHQTVQLGIGRPQHQYCLSRQGRDRLPDQYDDFALSLLNTLAETVSPEEMGTILHKQWMRKALDYRDRIGFGGLEERVKRLVALRQEEGYMAEWHMVPEPDEESSTQGSQFIITEYNCAISHVARSFPSICGHELEMFQVALDGVAVERTHWLADGEHQCGYLVCDTSANQKTSIR